MSLGAREVQELSQAVVDADGAGGLGQVLPRVVADAAVAVLLVDREQDAVVFANKAATDLTSPVELPIGVDRWSEVAGLLTVDGQPLVDSDGPLSRVAHGVPVTGEPIRLHRSQAPDAVISGRGSRGSGELSWVTGFPLDLPGQTAAWSLVVLLPVEEQTGQTVSGAGAVPAALSVLRDQAVGATDICFTLSDPRQPGNPLVSINPAFTRVTGYTPEQALGRNCSFLQGPGTDPAVVQQLRDELAAGGPSVVTLLNYRADGTAFWNQVSINPVRDGAGELVSFVGVQADVTERVLADAQRAAAAAAETAALAAEKAANRRLQVMAEATTELSGTLDTEELLGRLAGLCVPSLADWLFIAEVDPDQVVQRVITRHRDGAQRRGLLREVERAYSGHRMPELTASAQALRSGQVVARHGLGPDVLRAYGQGLEAEVFPALGTGSLVAVPLVAQAGTWGVLVLVRAASEEFAAADLSVAADLGRRAGQALDNARSYGREARIAETLQRALLPTLPTLPGITAAAHYASASAAAAIGGDFYDLLALPGEAVGVVIGDVAGHGIEATATMSTIRDLVRASYWDADHPTPADVLARVDRLLDALEVRGLATAALLRLHRPTDGESAWTVECSNAGHPPVLAIHPDGHVAPLCDRRGLLLGADPTATRPNSEHLLPTGTTLVLYTDGLIEQPDEHGSPGRDIDAGTARLHDLLGGLPAAAGADQVCQALHPLSAGQLDDTAILVVTLGG